MNEIKVLLVDDHAVIRMGLVSLLGNCREIRVVGDTGDGADAIVRALKTRPDVVIMDLMMPEMDGIETTRRLLAAWPEAKVLILTTFGASDGISQALRNGARGAILKSADLNELRKAIAAVSRGESSVSDEIAQIMADEPPLKGLSDRQVKILESVTRGLSNEDIARQFGISLATVKEHIKHVCRQMGAANRTEAVAIALRRHLIKI